MPAYEYQCECGERVEIEKSMDMVGQKEICSCGKEMKRIYSVPLINWNHWVPDCRQMDAEKEAIAAGMYE